MYMHVCVAECPAPLVPDDNFNCGKDIAQKYMWSGGGGHGSVVRALVAKARGSGFDSRRLPRCFLFQQAF